jgi:hypothetical protein
MKRIVPLVITSLLVAACGGMEPDGETPGQAGYLFGLSAAQIERVVLHYDQTADVSQVLEQMRAPFSCSRFGDLCQVAGEKAAQQILADTWEWGLSLTPKAEIESLLDHQLRVARRGRSAPTA